MCLSGFAGDEFPRRVDPRGGGGGRSPRDLVPRVHLLRSIRSSGEDSASAIAALRACRALELEAAEVQSERRNATENVAAAASSIRLRLIATLRDAPASIAPAARATSDAVAPFLEPEIFARVGHRAATTALASACRLATRALAAAATNVAGVSSTTPSRRATPSSEGRPKRWRRRSRGGE